MSTTPTVYAICDNNCRYETLTREQILTAIMQAVNEGTIGDIDAGFITTVKTINGRKLKLFVGSQSEYETLTDDDKQNLFAVITNDTTKEGINAVLDGLESDLDGLETKINKIVEGKTEVNRARFAEFAAILDPASAEEGDYETSSDGRSLTIKQKGIYVVNIYSVVEGNYYTAVITIPRISSKAISTVGVDISKTTANRVNCQIQYEPQGKGEDGLYYGYARIICDADYDYDFKFDRCNRIANLG